MVGKVKDISFRGKRPIFPWSFLPTPHLAASGSCGKPVERPPTESSGSWASRSFKNYLHGLIPLAETSTNTTLRCISTTEQDMLTSLHLHFFPVTTRSFLTDEIWRNPSRPDCVCFDRSSVATEPSSGGKWGFRSGRKAANMWCPLEWAGFWN